MVPSMHRELWSLRRRQAGGASRVPLHPRRDRADGSRLPCGARHSLSRAWLPAPGPVWVRVPCVGVTQRENAPQDVWTQILAEKAAAAQGKPAASPEAGATPEGAAGALASVLSGRRQPR